MDDDVLAGIRVLVIGGNREEAESLRAALTAACSASVDVAPALELVAAHAAAVRPEVVIALEDVDPGAVGLRLDPMALGSGPAVIAAADLAAGGRRLARAGLHRLRLERSRTELRARVSGLEAVVAEQALGALHDAERVRADTLERLAIAAGYRDDNSPEHTRRVAALAARMARHLGQDDQSVARIRQAAPLHDLGKIAIPDSILLKPGRLEPEEFEVVKTHAILGARVLAGGDGDLLACAERIARSHHERWDGGGYPDGLAGEAIPLAARLVGVADVFDVLVHERPYKEAWTVEDAAREIRAGAGSQFDPGAVAAFDALGAGAWTTQLESS